MKKRIVVEIGNKLNKATKNGKWSRQDSVELALFAVNLVVDIFENEYPGDKDLKLLIDEMRAWLNNQTLENADAIYLVVGKPVSYYELKAPKYVYRAVLCAARAAIFGHHHVSAYRTVHNATLAARSYGRDCDEIKSKCYEFVLNKLKGEK